MAQINSKDYYALKKLIKAIEELDENTCVDIYDCQNRGGVEYALLKNALSQNRDNSFYKYPEFLVMN